MELSLLMRLRILAAMLVGGLIIGVFGFGMARPDDPLAPVSLFTGQIGMTDALVFAFLAFLCGFLAYFASYPAGRPIAPLAVPTGLAVWIFRSGTVRTLLLTNDTVVEKMAVYSTFLWEGAFWFILIVIGYMGVLVAEKIKPGKIPSSALEFTEDKQKNMGLRYAMGIVASVVVTMFCIGIFAQDVKRFDADLGSVIGQPSSGQVAFAVIVSFALAAFICKIFLNTPPIIPAASSVVLMVVAVKGHATQANITYITENWAVSYFPDALCAILPIQAVAFAVIGSVLGFWLGVRYQFWQKYERENTTATDVVCN